MRSQQALSRSLRLALTAAAFLTAAVGAAVPPCSADGFDASTASDLVGKLRSFGQRAQGGSRRLYKDAAGVPQAAPAPPFVLPGLRGETLVLADSPTTADIRQKFLGRPQNSPDSLKVLTGKPTLLVFWGTWAKNSVDSLPDINNLYAHFAGQGVQVVAIAVRSEQAAVLDTVAPMDHSTHQRTWKYGFTFAMDDGYVSAPYSFQAVPAFVLIDASGKVVLQAQSFNQDQLYAAIHHLLP